ncbi:MAG TPA: DMT family transporter [Xanthobacteraceae bacterium]|jgi:drug/metabolite transporter (DMT)-like permease|nr:DMT family transporter [Xanthobacteraceae bacterium]
MLNSRENIGLLLGLIGVTIFAGTLPAARLAVPFIDPWFLTFARATIAGLLAIVIVIATRRPLPPRHTWPSLVTVAFCLVIGFPALSTLAMVTVPAAHGSVVLGILPLATATTAAILAHERPNPTFWLAGVAGAAIVVTFAFRHNGAGSLAAGDLLLLVSILTCAIGYTLSAKLSALMSGWEVICWVVILMLPLTLLGTILFWPPDIGSIPTPAWASLFYVAFMSQLLGLFAWSAGLAMGGIAKVGQVQLLQPFISVGLAALINREPIDVETVLFAAAVVATVMIGRITRVARPLKPQG